MFEKIIGNNNIKEYFKNSFDNNKISHSYLFLGIDGIGKKLFANELAKNVLCLENGKCKDKCKSCIEFVSNNNPDFQIIEPDGNSIKVEQIRNLQSKIQEKPIISNKKIYIINNAEKMTKEAQNCLLKTLEEPPEYAVIILIGNNESLFLDTIKSRCIILHFESIKDEELKSFLQKNYQMQSLNEDVLQIFQGSIGKALELKDKIDNYIQIEKIICSISEKQLIDIVNDAKVLYDSKDEIFSYLEYINVILLKLSKENHKYTKCIQIVENTKERLKSNSNYDMCIDYLLFNMWGEIN